jgi:hypothetical protein
LRQVREGQEITSNVDELLIRSSSSPLPKLTTWRISEIYIPSVLSSAIRTVCYGPRPCGCRTTNQPAGVRPIAPLTVTARSGRSTGPKSCREAQVSQATHFPSSLLTQSHCRPHHEWPCSNSPPRRCRRRPRPGVGLDPPPHASAARACARWRRGPRARARARRCGRRSGWCWCGTGRARGTPRAASRGAPTPPCSRPRGRPRPRPAARCSPPTPSTPASPARWRAPAAPPRSSGRGVGVGVATASYRTPTSARSISTVSRSHLFFLWSLFSCLCSAGRLLVCGKLAMPAQFRLLVTSSMRCSPCARGNAL